MKFLPNFSVSNTSLTKIKHIFILILILNLIILSVVNSKKADKKNKVKNMKRKIKKLKEQLKVLNHKNDEIARKLKSKYYFI